MLDLFLTLNPTVSLLYRNLTLSLHHQSSIYRPWRVVRWIYSYLGTFCSHHMPTGKTIPIQSPIVHLMTPNLMTLLLSLVPFTLH